MALRNATHSMFANILFLERTLVVDFLVSVLVWGRAANFVLGNSSVFWVLGPLEKTAEQSGSRV